MAARLPLGRFSGLVGDIYDCALDPGRWPSVLDEICSELGFVNAVLALQPLPAGPTVLTATTGLAPQFLDTLPVFGNDALAQWGGVDAALARPVGEPLALSRINPAACSPDRTDDYYVRWRQPQGLVDTLNITLLRDPTMIGVVSLGRHRDAGLIADREIELARLLVPHLRRAVTISRILDARAIEAATFGSVLDRLAVPTIIAGPRLEICYANAAARDALSAGSVVRSDAGALQFASRTVGAKIRETVRHAVSGEADIGALGLAIGSICEEGIAYVLHVLPLREGALRPGMVDGAAAAIFLRTPAVDPGTPFPALGELFELTPTELRVFEMIAKGMATGAIAASLRVRPSTVKTHLLHVFDKLGVGRQSDLVRLAAGFAAPVRTREKLHIPDSRK